MQRAKPIIEYTIETELTRTRKRYTLVDTTIKTAGYPGRIIVQTTDLRIVQAIIKSGRRYAIQ